MFAKIDYKHPYLPHAKSKFFSFCTLIIIIIIFISLYMPLGFTRRFSTLKERTQTFLQQTLSLSCLTFIPSHNLNLSSTIIQYLSASSHTLIQSHSLHFSPSLSPYSLSAVTPLCLSFPLIPLIFIHPFLTNLSLSLILHTLHSLSHILVFVTFLSLSSIRFPLLFSLLQSLSSSVILQDLQNSLSSVFLPLPHTFFYHMLPSFPFPIT